MDWLHIIILGIVEGITEFLPISSTGHLMLAEKLLGYSVSDPGLVAFTAVVQIGAIAAAIVYFWQDIWRIASAWCAGVVNPRTRTFHYRMGWYVIIGSLPIAVVGLLLKDTIETVLRGLWFVAAGLMIWSVVLFLADRRGRETRHERNLTWRDAMAMGLMQCLSLIPGVSRSGATIASGLFRDIDRTTATRMSFFLGIPALMAAGGLEAITQSHQIGRLIGWPQMILGIIISFVVGYVAISWLLRFVSSNSFDKFVAYRLVLSTLLIILLAVGALAPV